MDSVELNSIDWETCRPLAGRIILEIEDAPHKIGLVYTPETTHTQREKCITCKVLAVGYGPYLILEEQPNGKKKNVRYSGVTESEIKSGDRVAYRTLLMEIGQKRIVTDVRRVDAVL